LPDDNLKFQWEWLCECTCICFKPRCVITITQVPGEALMEMRWSESGDVFYEETLKGNERDRIRLAKAQAMSKYHNLVLGIPV